MKEITVKNFNSINPQRIDRGAGNVFTIRSVISRTDASRCQASFIEVEPGNQAFSYHYHEMNEEVFYIISGKAIVRTINGEITLRAGDIITFPAGKEGTHVIRNGSDNENLVYIDFGAVNVPEIVHFPETKKIMVVGPFSNGTYDEK